MVPIFPKEKIILKQREQKLIKVEAPFLDEISGLAIIKLLDKSTQGVIVIKVKFTQNLAILDMMNGSAEILILNLKEALGILDKKVIDKEMKYLFTIKGRIFTIFKPSNVD